MVGMAPKIRDLCLFGLAASIAAGADSVRSFTASRAAPAAPIGARKPLSFNECGGGFTTMTQGMGLTRAFAMVDGAWPQVDGSQKSSRGKHSTPGLEN